MRQATVRGFDIREAFFAWLDACNRKPKAELLQGLRDLVKKGFYFLSDYGTIFKGRKHRIIIERGI